jgi:hypothetical protein
MPSAALLRPVGLPFLLFGLGRPMSWVWNSKSKSERAAAWPAVQLNSYVLGVAMMSVLWVFWEHCSWD